MRLDLIARRYFGVKWQHQGRNPAIALDCIGLLVVCERELGGVVRDQVGYPRNPHGDTLEAALREHYGSPIPKADMAPGDAVSMRFRGPVRHAGIIGEHRGGGLSLIHTDSHVGKVTEHAIDARWLGFIVNVYRRPSA